MSGTIGQRLFSAIAHSSQLRLGQEYQIVAVTDISPLMTEMVISHKNSSVYQGARVYHVLPEHHNNLRSYWSSEAYMLDGMTHDQLHKPLGLKSLGQEIAFVYELKAGVSLRRLLEHVGKLDPNMATRIVVDSLKALEAVYARGGAHFMLKPSDIILEYNGSVSLRNFGLFDFELQVAKLLGISSLMDVRYTSPEHQLGSELTVSADLYSMGAVLFEALTGRLPFEGDYADVMRGHLESNPPNPQAINSDVNLGLARILMRALAKQPDQRFMHLSEFKQALAFMLPAGERDDIVSTPGTDEQFWSEADRTKIDHDLNMANQTANSGDYEGAIQLIDGVLRAFPGHEGTKMLRAQFQNRLYEPQIKSYMSEAQTFMDQQDFDSALKKALIVIEMAPTTAEAWSTVRFIFEQVLDQHSHSVGVYDVTRLAQLASQQKMAGQTVFAQRLYALVLQLDPNHADASSEWQSLLSSQSAPESATASLGVVPDGPTVVMPVMKPNRSAPPIAPPSSDDINDKDTVMRPMSELLDMMDQAVSNEEQHGLENAMLEIQTLLNEGRTNEALEKGKVHLNIYPDDPALKDLLERAASQVREQAIDRGMHKIEQLLSKKDFSGVHKVASGILKIRPEHEGAKLALEQAQSQVATGRELVKFLRQINKLEMQGQLDQASSLLEHAEQEFSDVPELRSLRQRIQQKIDIRNEAEWRFTEAQSMVQRGNMAGAIEKLNELVDRHPNFTKAHQLLESIGAPRTMKFAKDKELVRDDAKTELLPAYKPQASTPQAPPQAAYPSPPSVPYSQPVAPSPPAAPVAYSPSAPASEGPKKSKKGLLIGVVGLLVVVVLAVGGFMYKKHSDRQNMLGSLYADANKLETEGDWAAAVTAWESIVVEAPDFRDVRNRHSVLQDRMRQRKQTLVSNLETAKDYIDDGLLIDSSDENAVAYLKRNLAIDAEHQATLDLLERVRNDRMDEAILFFEDGKIQEARGMYDVVREIDPDYVDEAFQTRLNTWIFEHVVEPELVKLDRAIKRKKWDEAFQITDDLYENVSDRTPIVARWNEEMAKFEQLVADAQEKNQAEKVLGYLQIMARIRPEDIQLQDRKNLLNRELNNAKIRETENKLEKALSSKNYARAGLLANELMALDSEHGAARDALQTSISNLEDTANKQLKSNPRLALKTYDSLVRISNTSNLRNDRAQLRRKLQEFDGQFTQLKQSLNGDVEDIERRIDGFLNKYRDFSQDDSYAEATGLQTRLNKEKENLERVLQWERKAETDQALTYEKILESLKANSGLSMAFAKQPVARLIAKYEEKIINYRGGVTLVIKGAANLPNANDIGNKAPEAFCELQVGGSKFKTEIIKDERNPVWNLTCAFEAKGDPMVFRMYDDNKFGKAQLLGALQIPQVPKSGKSLKFNSPDGWSVILDVRRER